MCDGTEQDWLFRHNVARLSGHRGVLRLRPGRRAVLLVEEQQGLGGGVLPLLQEHVIHSGKRDSDHDIHNLRKYRPGPMSGYPFNLDRLRLKQIM